MEKMDRRRANEETQDAWESNAAFWDDHMGEGNDFVDVLSWPAIERLLALRSGERVLDVACGNGLTSRRLGRLGGRVTAFDFAPTMIERARARTEPADGAIDYQVIDATDEGALLALGEGSFEAAISNMALMDMAEIDPLFRALARLLVPGGRFVFTIMHPCFNNPYTTFVAEREDQEGTITTAYTIKVMGYMTPGARRGLALFDQPKPHVYFHRPLHMLLGSGLAAGFVVDGLEERSFAPEVRPDRVLGWSGNYSEFPPVLVVRMRLA